MTGQALRKAFTVSGNVLFCILHPKLDGEKQKVVLKEVAQVPGWLSIQKRSFFNVGNCCIIQKKECKKSFAGHFFIFSKDQIFHLMPAPAPLYLKILLYNPNLAVGPV